jgi:hypothetical protein
MVERYPVLTVYTREEVDDKLKLSTRQVDRLINEGKLRATRLNSSVRVRAYDLNVFLIEAGYNHLGYPKPTREDLRMLPFKVFGVYIFTDFESETPNDILMSDKGRLVRDAIRLVEQEGCHVQRVELFGGEAIAYK